MYSLIASSIDMCSLACVCGISSTLEYPVAARCLEGVGWGGGGGGQLFITSHGKD